MQIIGHRGAHGLAPENTVSSLLKGIANDVDEIEFDVRVTKDGIAIGHHDPTIVDASGASYVIRAHTFSELQLQKPDLATLDEAINAINRRVPLTIEIKADEPTAPIIGIVERCLSTGWQPHDFLVASFNPRILRKIHSALPGIGIIVNERWSGVRATYRARKLGTRRITMNQRWLWSGFIRRMHQSGYALSAYTINAPDKAKRWASYGLYGVVTDYPDRFRELAVDKR